jgi:hypothetical protein
MAAGDEDMPPVGCSGDNTSKPLAKRQRPAFFHKSSGTFVSEGVLPLSGLLALCWCWSLNYNKLASFYDYSIVSDGAGKLADGLRPFRHFMSAVQSLSLWLAYVSELAFGHRYLSLAYANLIVAVGLFAVILHYAKQAFSGYLATLIATAVAVASVLQHGIVWYNSIALVLLTAITLKCASHIRSRSVRVPDLIILVLLLAAIGLTKINFYFSALAIISASATVFSAGQTKDRRTRLPLTLLGLLTAVTVGVPCFEAAANQVSLATWFREVILIPGSRAHTVSELLRPQFYLGTENNYYPGTILSGGVLVCLLVYVTLAWRAVRTCRRFTHNGKATISAVLALSLAYWGAMCLLIVSNVDIESLAMSFSLIGLTAIASSFGNVLDESWRRLSRFGCGLLAAYFLVVGTVSCIRHSRLLYEPGEFTGTAVPASDSRRYLHGVELSQEAADRLSVIANVVRKSGGATIYWGPGLELMNRISAGVSDPALPLWWHMNVTIRDSDAPAAIRAIENSRASLMIAEPIRYNEFPEDIRRHFESSWAVEREPLLIVFRRRGR